MRQPERVTITAITNYTYLFEPVHFAGEAKPYYRMDVIVPKSDRATVALIVERVGDTPLLRDGDAKQPATRLYRECYYFTAKKGGDCPAPLVVGATKGDQTAGRRAKVTLTFRPYKNKEGEEGLSAEIEEVNYNDTWI